jgi:hypothetical protein
MKDVAIRSHTRRHFFESCGVGVGRIALAAMLGDRLATAQENSPSRGLHFRSRAKSVIYLFMAGGPSQLDLFDYKPKLRQYHDQPAPASFLNGKRFAFMDSFTKTSPKLLASSRKFQQYGQTGTWVSENLPHLAQVVDELAFLYTVGTENFNHAPAKLYANTGSTRFGRPSMGAWITYGIGSDSKDLPGFVVLQSGPRGPRGGALNWGNGFLPSAHQGVPFRTTGDPIVDLSTPDAIDPLCQRQTVDAIADLNRTHYAAMRDPEIEASVTAYEIAYRMQTSGPELIDISKENRRTLEAFGAVPGAPSFANNCLLARRLVERGVRFVQLYHTDWDHHADISKPFDEICREIDRPIAALIGDLKQRALLNDTLVIWGGEFGRTPMGEVRTNGQIGRNHHIDVSTMWMAGGGVRPGARIGVTDEFGFSAIENPLDMHDVHATILYLLGIDHTKLTFRSQGRDFRLTDVAGNVVRKIVV